MSQQRFATFAERCTWGTCPVCGATHGKACDATIEGPIWFGVRPNAGAHQPRLSKAPVMVRSVLEAVR